MDSHVFSSRHSPQTIDVRMSVVDDWGYSIGGRLFAVAFIAGFICIVLLAVSSIDLAEPDPSLAVRTTTSAPANTGAAEVASPTTEERSSRSCDVIIIESIFNSAREAEVVGKSGELSLAIETFPQSQQVTVAFVRYSSESERDQIFEVVRNNGWPDAYTSVLEPSLCEESA